MVRRFPDAKELKRIKYYSDTDLSLGFALKEAAQRLDEWISQESYSDINDIIEMYNIKQVVDSGLLLKGWDYSTLEDYQNRCKPFMKTIKVFFDGINDNNFIEILESVCQTYVTDFWELFNKFKVYEHISEEAFNRYLLLPDTIISDFLVHKEIVKKYSSIIAPVMRLSSQTPEVIINNYLRDSTVKYCLPEELRKEEYEGILQRYVDSDSPHPNDLQLIFNASSTGECPISDKLRLLAKKRYYQYWEEHKDEGIRIETGVSVGFQEQQELKKVTETGMNYHIAYDISWFEANLDFATILNNFIYLFEMFDYCQRCSFVSVGSQMSPIEDVFLNKGKRTYKRGHVFDVKSVIASAQMDLYYDYLSSKNIQLEKVYKWFFEEYLAEEFGVSGFLFNPSSKKTTYEEKYRTLVIEMDAVLKQFRMFVNDGDIDRELFELSSEHIVLSEIPSFIQCKYSYAKSEIIKRAMHSLFSNQAVLSYTQKTMDRYSTLFELISNERMKLADFNDYQRQALNELIQKQYVNIADGYLERTPETLLLRDLYLNGVLCPQYFSDCLPIIEKWIDKGDLRIESTLFSEPEQNYLNYILNKSEFSDGLDLRNKYVHGTNTKNEEMQHRDYIELLKVLTIVVTKINEEFCLREAVISKV